MKNLENKSENLEEIKQKIILEIDKMKESSNQKINLLNYYYLLLNMNKN